MKGPTLMDEDIESFDHKQEFGKDKSTESSKSYESSSKGTTKVSYTPKKSAKEIIKQPSSTYAKIQYDSKFVNDDKSVQSVDKEDIAKEKAKEPSPQEVKLVVQRAKSKAPTKNKRTSLHLQRSLLVKQLS